MRSAAWCCSTCLMRCNIACPSLINEPILCEYITSCSILHLRSQCSWNTSCVSSLNSSWKFTLNSVGIAGNIGISIKCYSISVQILFQCCISAVLTGARSATGTAWSNSCGSAWNRMGHFMWFARTTRGHYTAERDLYESVTFLRKESPTLCVESATKAVLK